MDKKILFMIAILVIIIVVIFIWDKTSQRSSAACSGAPFLERSKCDQLNSWLNQKLVEWKPIAYHPMKFGALFPPLSYGGDLYQSDTKFVDQYISMMKDLNLDLMRTDLYYDAWLNNDAKHIKTTGEAISRIKDNGYKLMIVNIGAKEYEKKPVSWATYKRSTLEIMRNFTKEYGPDYYIVAAEPVTYSRGGNHAQTSEPVSADQWVDFTDEACKLIKSINSETKVAIETTPFEKEYFEKATKLGCLDIAGITVYDAGGLERNETAELLALVKKEGKEAWILETWLDWRPSVGKSWKKELDAKWINVSVDYAQNNNLDGYVTFFTRHFFSYSDKQFEGYMPAFNAYKSIVEEVRNNAK